jgi:hypothetical protein
MCSLFGVSVVMNPRRLHGDASRNENFDLPKKTPWRETSSIEVDYTAFYSKISPFSIDLTEQWFFLYQVPKMPLYMPLYMQVATTVIELQFIW